MNTDKTREKVKSVTRYMGVDWRDTPRPLSIKPNDSLMFCDLRDCSLEGLDLTYVEFLGCRLNGTSFQKSILCGTRFIGCFSSHSFPPTDFRNSVWEDVKIIDSHLHYLSDQNQSQSWCWPDGVAEATTGTLLEREDDRYDAVNKIGQLANPLATPILGCLLTDANWAIVTATLKALAHLYGTGFPYRNHVLLEWIFMCLGDEYASPRQTAGELVALLSPPESVLQTVVNRMKSPSSNEQHAGLLAAYELCSCDQAYCRLVDLDVLEKLLLSNAPVVRSESLHLLGILDDPVTLDWLLRGLHDPIATVRIAALNAMKLLSDAPPANTVIPLLEDVDEDVRIEAIYTLGQLRNFDWQDVEIALTDPSAEVRQLAQKLLDST